MGRLSRSIPAILLAFVAYIVFSGSVSVYDIVTGVVLSIPIGIIAANLLLTNPSKILNVKRWLWFIVYAIYYFFKAEVDAHVDVIKRILNPKMPINPGIVKIPIRVSTDYALTAVALSITNTPGTVVVEVDEKNKYFYIHWIDVKAVEPEEARKQISEVFEKYSTKIFD